MRVALGGIGPWPLGPYLQLFLHRNQIKSCHLPHVTGDGELGSLAHRHLSNPLLPSSYHLLLSQGELEGSPPISGAVHLLSTLQSQHVMAGNL